ncbi:MAG: DNA-directed DNA polymerase II small subunit [Candidatus Micrarchaeota archaeon]|nr:DNA-directed DNA polymerase II small subunit [Candidatus Micrarchaeota archaeon]
MNDEEIVKFFEKEEVLLSPEAVEFLKGKGDDSLLKKILEKRGQEVFISKEFIEELIEEEKKIPLPAVEVKRASDFKPIAKEYSADLKLMEDCDVSGRCNCGGSVEDFVNLFRDRLKRTRRMLEMRVGATGMSNMTELGGFAKGREVRIIGMVTSKIVTKNGHILIELESEEGVAKVLALKSEREPERSCFEKANSLLLDEVIAVDGRASEPFVMATDVIWPDLPIRNVRVIDRDLCIAFLSDLHIGSRFFLQEHFQKMLGWLNGEAGGENGKELVGRIKYLIIAGDLVDGIGIYPEQEKELVMKDIYEQYDMLLKFISSIPDYVEVIISPGNHDAVRRAEPQPSISKELLKANDGRMHLIGNPSFVEIEGFKTLVYHGTSLDSIIAGISGMSYQHPEKPMVELLKRRNLSPIYGENPIVPESRDYMLIEEVPNIVHMGHVHKNGYENYKGTVVINSGTWQDQTDFQIRQGHTPSPCVLPILDLRSGRINVVNFLKREAVG